MAPPRIGIVGAGINGLYTALFIRRHFGDDACSITILAERFDEETTSDGAAGLFDPVSVTLGGSVLDNASLWRLSYQHYSELIGQAGIFALDHYGYYEKVPTYMEGMQAIVEQIGYPPGSFESAAPDDDNFRPERCRITSAQWESAFRLRTFVVEPRVHMRHLREQLSGVQFERRRIDSLDLDFDVIVNCAGLGARDLVGDDKLLHPVRGQIARVHAPWCRSSFALLSADGSEEFLVVPQSNGIALLGATFEANNWSTEVDRTTSERIVRGCDNYFPGLGAAPVQREWVGLRPMRESVRIELERTTAGVPVIHNYGHGGAGICLAPGSAHRVVQLLKEIF